MGLTSIKNNRIVSAEITTAPTKVTYYVGEAFDPTDMEIELTYEDGTTEIVDSFETTEDGYIIEEGDTFIKIFLFDQGQTIELVQEITTTEAELELPRGGLKDNMLIIDLSNDETCEIYRNNTYVGKIGSDGFYYPVEDPYHYLKFSCAYKQFSLWKDNTSHNGTLYYSTNLVDWIEWNGLSRVTSQWCENAYCLFFRGLNNTRIGSSNSGWQFQTDAAESDNLTVSGHLDALLDYIKNTNGETIGLEPHAYGHLFFRLPVKSVSNLYLDELAYQSHDSLAHQSKITNAPKITAKDIQWRALYHGFTQTLHIATLSKINPDTIVSGALNNVYVWSKHKVSSSFSYTTPYRFRIPYDENKTVPSGSSEMFDRCDGAPQRINYNQNYYTEYPLNS